MNNCIVFGASNGGRNFIKQQNKDNILFFIDNDRNKYGEEIEGKKIYAVEKILDSEYDYIIIASMFFKSISKQLLSLNVPKEKIKYAPKTLMKKAVYPFMDTKTKKYAWEVLDTFVDILNENDIKYFLEYGTLLGFYRSQDFIAWDDDIDISINIENTNINIMDITKQIIHSINKIKENINWTYTLLNNKEEKLVGIDFKFNENRSFKEFSINIGLITFYKDFAYQVMNYGPKKHFENYEIIQINGKKYKLPYDAEGYLEFTYGNDWHVEKKLTSFENNTKTFFEPNLK